MKIDKDTAIYASFSANPGNLGCARFNAAFEKNGVNAIYKSFKINDVRDAFEAARILRIKGFALSMPFKEDAKIYCDTKDFNVNTIIPGFLSPDHFYGYNTDIIGIEQYYKSIEKYPNRKDQKVYIIGMGAFAKSAHYVFSELGKEVFFINSRTDLPILENSIVFNASPLKGLVEKYEKNNIFIDSDTNTESGKKMSFFTAKAQYELIYKLPGIFEEV